MYFVWIGDSDGDGKAELDEVLQVFEETQYNPDASPSDHFLQLADYLRHHGFDEIRS